MPPASASKLATSPELHKHRRMISPKALILALAIALAPFLHAAKKPNVLFIFADDQCYETIRHLGITDIETPNLDRLMKSGTSFTRAYNMGSWLQEHDSE